MLSATCFHLQFFCRKFQEAAFKLISLHSLQSFLPMTNTYDPSMILSRLRHAIYLVGLPSYRVWLEAQGLAWGHMLLRYGWMAPDRSHPILMFLIMNGLHMHMELFYHHLVGISAHLDEDVVIPSMQSLLLLNTPNHHKQALRDEFRSSHIINCCVWPYESGEVLVQV